MVHIVINEGKEHDYIVKLTVETTNNEAEYEALLLVLTIVRSLGKEEA